MARIISLTSDKLDHPGPTEEQRQDCQQHPPQLNRQLLSHPSLPSTLSPLMGTRLGAKHKTTETRAGFALHVLTPPLHQQA